MSMLSQNKTLKSIEEVALHVILLCQVGVGTVANFLLFIHNFSVILTNCQLTPIQVIVTNLAVASAFNLLLLAFPNNVTLFVPRKAPSDLSCKLWYFICLVARSTNLSSTCVLSTYQFVMLLPGNWSRVILKGRAPKIVNYSCYGCWIFSVLNNAYIPVKVSGPQKTQNDTDFKDKWVCSTSGFSVGMSFLRFAHDALFISIMIWTNVSMVILLNRHHHRLQHIHSSNQDHRAYADTRAAHTILMLVVTFLSFYLLDCICTFFHISFVDSRLLLRRIKEVLTASFPTISPFLLIFRGPKNPCSLLSRS
ncbi:vomeronasal 1 receptor 38 [Rattus norvegicus]|uniref:Vomeronasal type-1 receptor n=1 Tax=Rattus norvegicus TaxID=10116 RepID=A0A8I6AC04_RAT|nr:vomeronasal 1 receptor 38 [Rattus norvegicus]|eukprot:NP_001008964.1 vomeronasal 1 receptor 38 [Rattus norvegicus]